VPEDLRRRPLLLLLAAGGFAALVGVWVALSPRTDNPLHPGMQAPDFQLPDLDGGNVSLQEQRGNVVFINFWGTWCAPCREEAPALERLYRELGESGFQVLAISIDAADGKTLVEAFRDEFDLSFPILLDPERRTYSVYQATGVPETFVVGPDGRLSERFVGPRDWDEQRYARAVERLLARRLP
jgi:peroxiredoxin